MRRIALVPLVLALAALVPGTASQAGSPGTWTKLNSTGLSNLHDAGMARTGDGILHLVWTQANAADDTNDDLMHATVAPDGTVSAADAILTNWREIQPEPDIDVLPGGGLIVVFIGTEFASVDDPHDELNAATSDAAGLTWELLPTSIARREVGAYGGSVVSAIAPDGTPFQFADSGLVHRGLDVATPPVEYEPDYPGSTSLLAPGAATDPVTGQMFVVWVAAFEEAVEGPVAQEVDPATGEPASGRMEFPDALTDFNGDDSFVLFNRGMPVVRRAGGGVYSLWGAGYPTIERFRLWKVGEETSTVVGAGRDVDNSYDLASDPTGRLWVVWEEEIGNDPATLHLIVSNEDLTQWTPEAVIKTPLDPSGFVETYGLTIEASGDRVDIVVNSSANDQGLYHTQMAAPPEWSNGDDVLGGTSGADFLFGGGGNDRLSGAGGKDQLFGGGGNDKVNGGPGKDVLNGGKGTDVCIFTKGDKMSGCEKKKRAH